MYKIIMLFALLISLPAIAQKDPLTTKDSIAQDQWVDSIMKTMNVDEKIGQLFMVAAYTNKDASHEKFIKDLITKHHNWGTDFFFKTRRSNKSN